MSGALLHSPAEVVRKLLVDSGGGTMPSTNGAWPIAVAVEQDKPDPVITVYNTQGKQQGRVQSDGEVQEQEGIQIRIRANIWQLGWQKAKAIADLIDRSVSYETVIVAASSDLVSKTYRVHSISRTSGVLDIGKEPNTKRDIFTVNAVVALTMIG